MSTVRSAAAALGGRWSARRNRRAWVALAAAALVVAGAGSGTPGAQERAAAQEQGPAQDAASGFDGDPATSERIGGGDPTGTAVAVSRTRFSDARGDGGAAADGAAVRAATHAVLSRPDEFADSLAGTALTGDGPLLFTAAGGLPADTAAELQRVLPPGGRVYLLGGTTAIGAPIAAEVASAGYDVVRLEGLTRVETALAVADEVRRRSDGGDVLLARATAPPDVPSAAWADAVTAGAVAAAGATPLLLTPGEALHPAVTAWLATDAPSRTVLLGGEVALSAAVADAVPAPQRVSGPDRVATAAAVARELSGATDTGTRRVVAIDGHHEDGWAYGLAAGGLAADAGASVLLVGTEVAPPSRALLAACGDPEVDTVLVGDRSVVTTTAERQIDALDGRSCTALPDGTRTLSSDLVGFDDCEQLLGYYRDTALQFVGPYGIEEVWYGEDGAGAAEESAEASEGAPMPAPAAPERQSGADDVSGTNLQEAGVDEPDGVKTDGRVALAVARGAVQVVDLTGAEPRLASTIPLPADQDGYPFPAELLLQGDDLLVLSTGSSSYGPEVMAYGSRADVATRLLHVDLSDPDQPVLLDETEITGRYVSARMVDGVARVVIATGPHGFDWAYPDEVLTGEFDEAEYREAEAEAEAHNRELVERSTLANWLPVLDGEDPLVDCGDVSSPLEFSGIDTLSVTTVDLSDGLAPTSSAAVVANGDVVYASTETLYVATSRWSFSPDPRQALDEEQATAIHAFDIADPATTAYTASGRVSGYVLNQFALSEHDGDLRVATTVLGACCDPETGMQESESAVTVLRPRDGGFDEVGRVDGLGVDEQIQAVRFMGDLAAVVTFRQIDPLYLIDLADPAEPTVLGELKVTGFSQYLHRIGEDLLLGIGQAGTAEGAVLGAQASTFDISDRSAPRLVDTQALGGSNSQSTAAFDHRSFLYWDPARLAAVPVEDYGDVDGPAEPTQGLVGLTVGVDGGLEERGRVSHAEGDPYSDEGWYRGFVSRSFVVEDRLYTVSERGLGEADLETVASRSFTEFDTRWDQTAMPEPEPGLEPAPSPVPAPDQTEEG